jgi:cell division transport system permease protein
MSLNLLYSFREGVKELRRARLATVVTVSTLTISLTLLGVFLVFTVNVQRVVEHFRERMAIEIFVEEGLNSASLSQIKDRIMRVPGVEEAVYVSPEEGLARMREELGIDPVEILGSNPLPGTFQISVNRENRTYSGIRDVAQKLEVMEGVEDVVYHGRLFQTIDRYSRVIFIADSILLFVVLLASILLVSNTLRLTILSHQETIQIMHLVGATNRFIRRPYLIQGILQGGIGGLLGSFMVWGVLEIISLWLPRLLKVPVLLIFVPFFLGLLFGYIGSRLGLQRFLKGG